MLKLENRQVANKLAVTNVKPLERLMVWGMAAAPEPGAKNLQTSEASTALKNEEDADAAKAACSVKAEAAPHHADTKRPLSKPFA